MRAFSVFGCIPIIYSFAAMFSVSILRKPRTQRCGYTKRLRTLYTFEKEEQENFHRKKYEQTEGLQNERERERNQKNREAGKEKQIKYSKHINHREKKSQARKRKRKKNTEHPRRREPTQASLCSNPCRPSSAAGRTASPQRHCAVVSDATRSVATTMTTTTTITPNHFGTSAALQVLRHHRHHRHHCHRRHRRRGDENHVGENGLVDTRVIVIDTILTIKGNIVAESERTITSRNEESTGKG